MGGVANMEHMFEGPSAPGLLLAALTYARAGLPVLPLHTPGPAGHCSCRRAGCDRVGKHPRLPHGLTQASTDPGQVRAWWSRWPTANLGLRTGTLTDVCDIDSDTGRDALLRLLGTQPRHGPLVRTGSGGWHLYLAATGYGNRVRLLPGVDWRGVGGYVVAPPSHHACGQQVHLALATAAAAAGLGRVETTRTIRSALTRPRRPLVGFLGEAPP